MNKETLHFLGNCNKVDENVEEGSIDTANESDKDCNIWTITAPADKQIKLDFILFQVCP